MFTAEQTAERNRLLHRIESNIQSAEAERRDLTPEEIEQNRQWGRQVDMLNQREKLESFRPAGSRVFDKIPGERFSAAPAVSRPAEPAERYYRTSKTEAGDALNYWAMKGRAGNALYATIGTTTAGGAMLPREITAPITAARLNVFRQGISILGMDAMSIIETPLATDMKAPVPDAQAGGILPENASGETENAWDLSESINLKPSAYHSGPCYFSNALLASGMDVTAALVPGLMISKELALESAMVAALIADTAITQIITAGSVSAITYANLVDLELSLPDRFGQKKFILLSSAAFAAAKKLTDSAGAPLLRPDPRDPEALSVGGTPALRTAYLEAFGAGKVVGACVSCVGLRVRDVTPYSINRIENSPDRPNQTGFDLLAYHGYGWAPSAVAKLKTAAT